MKRVLTGVVLGGFFLGLVQGPVSLAACQIAAKANICCCPMAKMGSLDCCAPQKATKCPILKKSDPAVLAILPTPPLMTFVLVVQSAPALSLKPVADQQFLFLSQGLSPPCGLAISPPALRAPPALA